MTSKKDWLYISKRSSVLAWAALRGLFRRATPSILMAGAIIATYEIGHAGAQFWWVLVPMIFGGFAIGAAEDRAESRASNDWATRFWRLIETDHMLEINVTHSKPASQ